MLKGLLVLATTLVFSCSLAATAIQIGQNGPPHSTTPGTFPGSTPPTFPSDSHPSSTFPPDTHAPPATESSNAKVEQQIRTAISQDHRLNQDQVEVAVDTSSVTLSGRVSTHDHRYLVIRIANEFSTDRSVVDKLRVGDEQ